VSEKKLYNRLVFANCNLVTKLLLTCKLRCKLGAIGMLPGLLTILFESIGNTNTNENLYSPEMVETAENKNLTNFN